MDLCEYFQSGKSLSLSFFFLETLNEEFFKFYLVVHKTHDLNIFKAEASVTVTKIPWFGTILNDIGKSFS